MLCILQYMLNVFYFSSDSYKSKICDYPTFKITEEDLKGMFPPDDWIHKKRAELK